jgi:hypothetical protein
MESSTVAALRGKTVTFSIKIKRSATFNANITLRVDKSATNDAGSGASWTTISSLGILSTDLSSSVWTTFKITCAIPNDGTANSLRVYQLYNTNPVSGSSLDLAQTQLEIGSTVTEFSRAGGTIQGELSACMRYYNRILFSGTGQLFGTGQAFSTTGATIWIPFPVIMRTSPTALEQTGSAGNDALLNATGSGLQCTAVPTFGVAYPNGASVNATVGSGLVAGNATRLGAFSTDQPYLGWSAEL